MTKRLILHVGSPKTGTTAIQEALHRNHDTLRDAGVNYVAAGRSHISHNGVVARFRDGRAAEFCAALAREIDASPAALHVVSSELFFRPAAAARVADGLARHLPAHLRDATVVICYLRRHDRYLEALYKQLVKTGRADPDPAGFLGAQRRKLSYLASVRRYAALVGEERMIVRPFERTAFPGGDVVRDFVDRTGMPAGAVPPGAPPETVNRTLSAEVTELVGHLGRHSGLNTRRLVRDIIAEGAEGAFGSNDVYDAATRRAVIDAFDDEDSFLRARFAPGQDRATFFDRSDIAAPAEGPAEGPDNDDRSDTAARWHRAAGIVARAVGRQVPPAR